MKKIVLPFNADNMTVRDMRQAASTLRDILQRAERVIDNNPQMDFDEYCQQVGNYVAQIEDGYEVG